MAGFDYIGAKNEGHLDEEIAKYLSEKTGFDLISAIQQGHGFAEINEYLAPTINAPNPDAPLDLPPPPVEIEEADSGFFRETLDVPVQLAKGATTGVRLIADYFGADNAFSDALRGSEDYLNALLSAQSKQDQEAVARIMAEAEDKGAGTQLKAAFEAFKVAPIDLVINAFGTSAPIILGSLAAASVAPASLATVASVTTAGTLGTMMGTGTVKSAIYDSVEQELIDVGVDPETAEKAAVEAQSYLGENTGLIASGGILGLLASVTGLEGSVLRGVVTRALGKTVATDVAEEALGQTAARSMVGQALRTGAIEGVTETAQGGQERYAANVALGREGLDVDPLRGVFSAAALEGMAGSAVGTGAGVAEVGLARRQLKNDLREIAEAEIELDDTLINVVDELGDDTLSADVRDRKEQNLAEEAAEAAVDETAVDETAETAVDETAGQPELTDEEKENNLMREYEEKAQAAEEAAEAAVDETEETAEDAGKREPTVFENAQKSQQAAAERKKAAAQRKKESNRINKLVTDAKKYFDKPFESRLKVVLPSEDVMNRFNAGDKMTDGERLQARTFTEEGGALANTRVEKIADLLRVIQRDPDRKIKRTKTADTIIENENVTKLEIDAAAELVKSEPLFQYEIDAESNASRDVRTSSAKPSVSVSVEPQPKYTQFKNVSEAIEDVKKTGNPLEKLFANRLGPFLKKAQVQLKIVDTIEDVAEENNVRTIFGGDGNVAKGLFARDQDSARNDGGTIYLNNIEGSNSGLDNATFLHEGFHAATVDVVNLYEANKTEGLTVAEINTVETLIVLKDKANTAMQDKINLGAASNNEIKLYDVGAFSDTKEFIAYGLTDADMQQFLLSTDGTLGPNTIKAVSLGNQFLNAIRKLFNISDAQSNAFLELIFLTDNLVEQAKVGASATVKVEANAARRVNAQEKADKKFKDSQKASELAGAILPLIQGRDINSNIDILIKNFRNMSRPVIKAILKTLSTEDIARWGSQIKNFANVQKEVNTMSGWRTNEMRKLFEQYESWAGWAKKNLQAQKTLSNLAFVSTLLGADPVTRVNGKRLTLDESIKQDPELLSLTKELNASTTAEKSKPGIKGKITKRTNDLKIVHKIYDKLLAEGGKEGVGFYEMAKNEYARLYQESVDTLKEKIKLSRLDSEGKKRILARVELDMQEANKKGVYFPLVRYGQFWLRVGKGRNGEFYMFESATQRDIYAEQIAAERGIDVNDADLIAAGDDIASLRAGVEDPNTSGQMLKSVYDLIDNSGSTTTGVAGAIDPKQELKDGVYQLYLRTLPNQSIRRRFIKRQGKTGFNTDTLRNFATTQSTAINQLARLKHSDKIIRAMESAQAELEGRPTVGPNGIETRKLQLLVDEFQTRVNFELEPADPNHFFDQFARFGNKIVFFYMMSAPKSALIQLTQLPIVGLPILSTRFGAGKTTAVMRRYLNLFNTLAPVEKKGDSVSLKWGAPSVKESSHVVNNPDKKRGGLLAKAFAELELRDMFNATYATDMTSAGQQGIGQASFYSKGFNALGTFMGGAFHNMERISREIMAMSSFELAYDEAIANGVDPETAFTQSVDEAVTLTYGGLFNYTQFNKPSISRGPVGKLATQFMTFPLQMTSYLVRNFYNMFKGLNRDAKVEAAQKFFGTLGMTFLFAGASGLPFLWWTGSGLLEGYRNLMRPGEDDDDADLFEDMNDPSNPFGNRPAELWLRDWFIPHHFGQGSGIADLLGLSDTQAQTLARGVEFGPISAFTDINLSAQTSLNAMWFRDDRESDSNRDAMERMAIKIFGPFGSMATQFGQASDDIIAGDFARGLEGVVPAIFRGPLKAYRLSQEGAVTRKNAVILPTQWYTTGKLLATGLTGFNSTTESEITKSNILAKTWEQEVLNERQSLMDDINKAATELSENPNSQKAKDKQDKVIAEIRAFSYRYPFIRFTAAGITGSIRGRQVSVAEANQGSMVSKNFQGIVNEMIATSRVLVPETKE